MPLSVSVFPIAWTHLLRTVCKKIKIVIVNEIFDLIISELLNSGDMMHYHPLYIMDFKQEKQWQKRIRTIS
jgi:SAM-dependent MidA family methyltransferase